MTPDKSSIGYSAYDMECGTSPMKMSNFDKDKSQIKSLAPDGSEMTVQINIDIFTLKIFALLMCKGSQKAKADIFFDLVVGPEGVK